MDDPNECDDKEINELKDTGKTKQHVSLENLDDSKGCAFNKPMARTNNAHKVQTISMTNLVLLSILFGIAGARTLENLDSNELVKETPSWVTPIMKGKNYEDKLISAYDCLDGTLPSTQISLKPPEHCDINDGSAYEKAERRKAQILEHVQLIPINITTCVVQFYASRPSNFEKPNYSV